MGIVHNTRWPSAHRNPAEGFSGGDPTGRWCYDSFFSIQRRKNLLIALNTVADENRCAFEPFQNLLWVEELILAKPLDASSSIRFKESRVHLALPGIEEKTQSVWTETQILGDYFQRGDWKDWFF